MWHPTKAHHRVTTRQSCCVSSVLSVVAVIIYSLVLWTTGSYKNKASRLYVCNFLPRYMDIIRIFSKADVFVAGIMPYTMLPILNLLVFLQVLIKCYSLQKYNTPKTPQPQRPHRIMSSIKSTRKHVQITLSMFFTSNIIWGLNIMYQWINAKEFFVLSIGNVDLHTKWKYSSIKAYSWILAHHLYDMSFAVKFVLYVIFSGLFRNAVLECCKTYQCVCSQSNESDDLSSVCDLCDGHHSCEHSLHTLSPDAPVQDNDHSCQICESDHVATTVGNHIERIDTTV